nr:hypothetical protein NG677_17495 [Methylobacterium sp. OTU13CASTA1]
MIGRLSQRKAVQRLSGVVSAFASGTRLLTLQDADVNFNYSAPITVPGKYRIHAWGAGANNGGNSGTYGSMDVVLAKSDAVTGKMSTPMPNSPTQDATTVIAGGRTMTVPSGKIGGAATGGDVSIAGSGAPSAGGGAYGGPGGVNGNATGGAGAPSGTPLLRGGQGGGNNSTGSFTPRNGPVGFPGAGGCGIFYYGSGYSQGNEHSTGGGAAVLLEYLGPK